MNFSSLLIPYLKEFVVLLNSKWVTEEQIGRSRENRGLCGWMAPELRGNEWVAPCQEENKEEEETMCTKSKAMRT